MPVGVFLCLCMWWYFMRYQVWFHQISGKALEASGNSANVFQQEKGSVGTASSEHWRSLCWVAGGYSSAPRFQTGVIITWIAFRTWRELPDLSWGGEFVPLKLGLKKREGIRFNHIDVVSPICLTSITCQVEYTPVLSDNLVYTRLTFGASVL